MAGEEPGPLLGVPVAVTDLAPVAGVPMMRGSRVFADEVPTDTALCVERLQRAGAIVVGKTNSSEFGFKATADNALRGPTSTPFDVAMNAGGCRGGSAAAGMVPLVQGFDAGGSLRTSAAFCGVFTMMSTSGRVPAPARPNAYRWRDAVDCYAPVARTVEDASLALDLMSGEHPGDPYSFPVLGSFADGLRPPALTGVRVACSPDLGGYPVEPEAEALVRAALPALEERGATVRETRFRPPVRHDELTAAWRRHQAGCHAESAAAAREAGTDLFGEHSRYVDPDYLAAAGRGRGGRRVRRMVADHPLHRDGRPAATDPVGRAANGVPVGMQIAARRHNDSTVVRPAAALEAQSPWHGDYQRVWRSLAATG